VKQIGVGVLAVGFGLLCIAAPLVFIFGAAWAAVHLTEYAIVLSSCTLLVCIVILLPLSIFRATRKFACLGLYVASIIFGASIWLTGFLVTWTYFGGLGVFIGLVMGLVGIVPLGIVAAMFNSDWSAVSFLLLGLVLTFGARGLSIWLASLVDRAAYETA
jgi:hypothetical protein